MAAIVRFILLIVVCHMTIAKPKHEERSISFSSSREEKTPEKKQPHIFLIMTDNSGYADVSWNDQIGVMKTPVLESLARSGVILNQTYVQPICAPTRAALMTGYYPFRSGLGHAIILPAQPSYLSREFKTLSEALKELGYSTHLVGKWHLGACRWDVTPFYRGFDSSYGPFHGMVYYYTHDIQGNPGYSPARYPDFRDNTGAVVHENGTHLSELFTKRAVDIVSRHNPNTPLFLYMPILLPHHPFQVPDRFKELYEPTPTVPHLQTYRGMMSMVDEMVDNVTKTFMERGMWDDTIMIYLSDNGGYGGTGTQWPFRGNMGTPFEGGIRSTAFVHGKLLKKTGYVNEELIHVTDIHPTLVSLAGGTPDPNMDGKNVWETISEGKPSPRNHFLIHYDNYPDVSPCTAIRVGDYKLIDGSYAAMRNVTGDTIMGYYMDRFYAPPELVDLNVTLPDVPDTDILNATLLFNIADDPREINDLSGEMPEKVEELRQAAAAITDGAPPPFFPELDFVNSDPGANYGGIWTPGWC